MSKSVAIELKEIEEIVTLDECNNEIKKCYFMINTLQMKSLKEHYDKLFEKLKEFDRNVSNAVKMAKIETMKKEKEEKEEKKRKELEESNLRKQQVEKEIQEGRIKKQMIMNEINMKKEELNEKEVLINKYKTEIGFDTLQNEIKQLEYVLKQPIITSCRHPKQYVREFLVNFHREYECTFCDAKLYFGSNYDTF